MDSMVLNYLERGNDAEKSRCVSEIGWCVGCNPPFVDCGIKCLKK